MSRSDTPLVSERRIYFSRLLLALFSKRFQDAGSSLFACTLPFARPSKPRSPTTSPTLLHLSFFHH
jgi:hypothetical protein